MLISAGLGTGGAYAALLAHRAQTKKDNVTERLEQFRRIDSREDALWARIETTLEVERQTVELLKKEMNLMEERSAKQQAELRAQIFQLEAQNTILRQDLSEVQAAAKEYSQQLIKYQQLEKELRSEIDGLRDRPRVQEKK